MTRYTNLHRRKECKEGATSWGALKAQKAEAAAANAAATTAVKTPSTRGVPSLSSPGAGAGPGSLATVVGWSATGIGRKRDSDKVKVQLDVYQAGQSADALNEADEAEASAAGSAADDTAPAPTALKVVTSGYTSVGRKKTASHAGKKKKAKKVVMF
eukprot:m.421714 g.421714  ORF g.421714 m.421714 type:complete len:157 (-) comp34727_c0_seq1:388-858(-)